MPLLTFRRLFLILFWAVVSASATAETSIFELRITNDTNTDLTFQLQDGKSKHADLTYNKKLVSKHTIKAGVSDTIGVKPTGRKCATKCGACNPSLAKVYAYYPDENGVLVRNNYYQVKYEFYEYCGTAATKPITTYTSNWSFKHGGGKGTNQFSHKQKSKNKGYTASSPARGLTFDAKYVSGHAVITYTEKD